VPWLISFSLGLVRASFCIAASLLLCSVARADKDQLTTAEVATVRRICATLVDSFIGDRAWRPLIPYLARKDALQHMEVVCSGSCGGSIPLRGGLSVDFVYVNPQAGIGVRRHVTEGERIYDITLRRSGTVIAHYGHPPKKT
jgi:hypothetical protein